MASSPPSFQKRQRERAKREKAAAKRARREERKLEAEGEDEAADTGPSEDQLLEQFRLLSERHDAGLVSDDDYEQRREEIFTQLGLAE